MIICESKEGNIKLSLGHQTADSLPVAAKISGKIWRGHLHTLKVSPPSTG